MTNKATSKRKVEIVVISDAHLGSIGCHSKELANYLKSIKAERLILNGDIIDMWQFKKAYFQKYELLVVNRILKMLANGTIVYYLTGNHDDILRRFSGFQNGNFYLRDQVVFLLNGKKHWFFHGDAFDIAMLKTRWLSKLGGMIYDWLIIANRFINKLTGFFGAPPISFATLIKMGIKKVVKFISDFEDQAIDAAKTNGYDVVICGHVHRPSITEKGGIIYLNSGDWIENLTALEYNEGKWSLFKYNANDFGDAKEKEVSKPNDDDALMSLSQEELINNFLNKKPAFVALKPNEVIESSLWDGIEK